MVRFGVSKEKAEDLRQRMESLGIHEKDIEERFIRSSGRGGQKVNKTSTCVYLKHLPTGIAVKWMTERSQTLNRFFARRELVSHIEKASGKAPPEERKIRQARRQKAKREKRGRLKYHGTDL